VPEPDSFALDEMNSRFARRVRVAARILTGVVAGACVWAMFLAPGASGAAAAVGALGALAMVLRPEARAGGRRLSIAGDGALQVLHCDGTAAPADVLYCGRSHVCLRTRDELLAVWPDALPVPIWRRLRVACRWRSAADDEDCEKRSSPDGGSN